jgi:pimeloyl-ACP methyl ester carboxylesterase
LDKTVSVTDLPQTRYAKSGDVHIAYQVFGAGNTDLVLAPGLVSNIEVMWEEPTWATFLRRLASFARVVVFDRRGMGSSDRRVDLPTLEIQMDDLRAVMDAARCGSATLVGVDDGGAMAALFAASFPDRVNALVLYSSPARYSYAPDYPDGFPTEVRDRFEEFYEKRWGSGDDIAIVVPSRAGERDFAHWWGRLQRLNTSPGEAIALLNYVWDLDVRTILSSIRVPTVVIHRRGDRFVPLEHGRYVAKHIPGASFRELDGTDHVPWAGDTEAIIGEIEELVTGIRSIPEPDRVLTTVLFTDIVASSTHLTELGDARWRAVLDEHDAIVDRALERYRGRKVNPTGDGLLATFDGPARAVRCACAIRDGVKVLGIDIRAGVHTGEVELRGDDLAGIAVHIGARIADLADRGEVLVTRTVTDLVAGSGLSFADRGEHALKGLPGSWHIFAVDST